MSVPTRIDPNATAFTPLQGEHYINLTTFRKNGEGVATSVWFVDVAGTVYLYTGAQVGKVTRIRHTTRVTLAPCTFKGAITGPTIVGTARLVVDAQEIRQVIKGLQKKYGWQYRLMMTLPKITGIFQRRPKAGVAYIAITPNT